MEKKFYLATEHKGPTVIIESESRPKMYSEGGNLVMLTPAYNSLEDLHKSQAIHTESCKECGGVITLNYIGKVPDTLIQKQLCFSCNHWSEIIDNKDNERTVIVKSTVYWRKDFRKIEKHLEHVLGFSGHVFNIKMKSGETYTTNDLWCSGDIPDRFKSRLPDKNTFDIQPIRRLIDKYYHKNSIDPFANSNRLASITNDINPEMACDYTMDAIDFLKLFGSESTDLVLYDPPYSPRQVAEVYKSMDKAVNMQTTQASYWGDQKREVGRIVKMGGIVITCGWNSGGIGMKYGFQIIEILLVPHGSWKNDTIVTVERKVTTSLYAGFDNS